MSRPRFNWLSPLLQRAGNPKSKSGGVPSRRTELGIEALEDRVVPATDITIFQGAAGTGALDSVLSVGGVITPADVAASLGTLSSGALEAIPASTPISVTAPGSIYFDLVPGPGSGTITLQASARFTANNGSVTFKDPGDSLSTPGSLALISAAPTVSVFNGGNAAEPSDNGSFFLTRSGGDMTKPLTVNLSTSGTATNGTDYQALPTTVTIPANQASVSVPVSVIDDAAVEGTETVVLTVGPGAGYTVGTSTATVSIFDNDPPTVSVFNNSDAAEPATDGAFVLFRSGGDLTQPLTVSVSTSGTATSGSDYQPLPTTVTFAANSTVAFVPVSVIDDFVAEGDETVVLTVNSGAGYVVGNSQDTVTIADNDPPTVSVSNNGDAAEPATDGAFLLTRSGGDLTQPLTVNLSTTGTATPGSDYQPLPITVTFLANQTSVSVPVSVIDDTLAEGDETVVLTVDPGAGYVVGNNQDTVTIQDDDTAEVSVTSGSDLAEPSTNGGFVLSRSGGDLTQPLTVNVFFSGSATLGADYQVFSSGVTFAPNSTTAFVPVNVIDDAVAEGTETVVLNIAPGAGYEVDPSASSFVVSLFDDEAASVSVFNNGNAAEASSNGSFVLIRSSGDLTQPLTVSVSVGGTATPGSDYQPLPTTVTFAANSTAAFVPVNVIDDLMVEGTETVDLTVNPGAGYVLGNSQDTVFIFDDDPMTVSVSIGGNALEPSSNGFVTLSRSGGDLTQPLTVNISTGGSATSGVDYQALPSTVTFLANQTSVNVPVNVIDDTSFEVTETVAVTVNPGAGYVVGTSAATVFIFDNDPPSSIDVTTGRMTAGGSITVQSFGAITLTGPIVAAGGASISILANDGVSLASGASLVTGSGDITIAANNGDPTGTADVVIGAGVTIRTEGDVLIQAVAPSAQSGGPIVEQPGGSTPGATGPSVGGGIVMADGSLIGGSSSAGARNVTLLGVEDIRVTQITADNDITVTVSGGRGNILDDGSDAATSLLTAGNNVNLTAGGLIGSPTQVTIVDVEAAAAGAPTPAYLAMVDVKFGNQLTLAQSGGSGNRQVRSVGGELSTNQIVYTPVLPGDQLAVVSPNARILVGDTFIFDGASTANLFFAALGGNGVVIGTESGASAGATTAPAPAATGRTAAVSPQGTIGVYDGGGQPPTFLLAPFPGFPTAVAMGDVTGDGVTDFAAVVTAPGTPAFVVVFDGATGSARSGFFAFPPSVLLGATIAIGDVDGDGRGEIIVGTGSGLPVVGVYDGMTGALRSAFIAAGGLPGGVAVAAGDLDGDGRAEIITGSLGAMPLITIFDAAGNFRSGFFTIALGGSVGVSVAAGDFDGDGRAEIVAGTGTAVITYDPNGTVRQFVVLPVPVPRFTPAVSATDTNGDGRAEVVVDLDPFLFTLDGSSLGVRSVSLVSVDLPAA